jgi:hypothetical protein
MLIAQAEGGLDAKSGTPLRLVKCIRFCEITSCKTEIINGIQQIGLPYSVPATDSYKPSIESKFRLLVVLKL